MKLSLKKSFNALHISRQRTSPFSAWVMLIIAFCVINVIQLGFVIHVTMSMAYGETLAEESVQIPAVETVERDRLEETIADFTARQNRFETLKTSYSAPQDPSL